ncbi:MAG: nucleotidyltransferase domain-containing protein [Candidatus Schekmanbacteria bacterium]|nr:nucleotidyltransferase domain-containing protein [Candidatus Schekmanbacteria bacterium]
MSLKKQLNKLANQCAGLLKNNYPTKRIFLIGSLAKGIVHEHSDIDLVVEGLPAELYIKALTELYDLLPPDVELNLIPYEDAFDSLKEKALSEGKLIYAS